MRSLLMTWRIGHGMRLAAMHQAEPIMHQAEAMQQYWLECRHHHVDNPTGQEGKTELHFCQLLALIDNSPAATATSIQ